MKMACNHAPIRVDVELEGRTVALNRCAACDLTWWSDHGQPVTRAGVYGALHGEAPRILRSRGVVGRLARPRSTAAPVAPMPGR